MPPKRLSVACSAALVIALFGAHARADDQSDLAKARAAYEAKNYEEADRRLEAMLNPDTGTLKDPMLRAQARMYLGASLLGLKRTAEANAVFEGLLLDNPSFEPDPLSFPGEVIDAVIDTRKRIIDKINLAKEEQARLIAERKAREEDEKRKAALRLRMLEKLASEDTILHSRWIALLPFGVGQFQNGQTTLGWVFLGSEAAMLAGAAIAFPFWYYNRSRVSDLQPHYPDPTKDPLLTYENRAGAAAIANQAFNGAFAATWLIGVVHAQLTFVPEVKVPRKVTVSVAPVIAPQPGGGFFGLKGSF